MKLYSTKKIMLMSVAVFCIALAAVFCTVGCLGSSTNESDYSWLADSVNHAAAQLQQQLQIEEERIKNDPTFRQGVTVCGVAVGGMTIEEATASVREALDEGLDGFKLTFTYETHSYEVTSQNIGLAYDELSITSTLDEAFNLARTGTLNEMNAEIADIAENGREFFIIPQHDEALFNSLIATMAVEIEIEPVDAQFTINKSNVNERFSYTEETNGVSIDLEGMQLLIAKHIAEVGGKTPASSVSEVIPTNIIEPEITVDYLKSIQTQRATFFTSYASGSEYNRVHNIRKAAGLVNGTILDPEEVFSTNRTLGDRTLEGGWLLAPGFTMGGAGTEDSPGGGVCQVSTTIYNAVILSDLNIVYRQNHSRMVNYIPGGRDATIDTGRIDFKFSNNTEHPIYIFCYLVEGKKEVHCEVYGMPFPDEFDRIDFYSEKISETPPSETEYVEVDWLVAPYWMNRNDARTGYVFKAFKNYYRGNVVVNTVEVNTSTYKMHPKRYYVWPGYNDAHNTLDPNYKLSESPSAPLPTLTPEPTPTLAPTPTQEQPPTAEPTVEPTTSPTSAPGPTLLP